MLVQSISRANIRTLNDSTDTVLDYIDDTGMQTGRTAEPVVCQEYIIWFLNSPRERKTSGQSHPEDLDPQQLMADITGTTNIDETMAVAQVPPAVVRFGENGFSQRQGVSEHVLYRDQSPVGLPQP